MIVSTAPKIFNQLLRSQWSAWLLRLFCFMSAASLIAINASIFPTWFLLIIQVNPNWFTVVTASAVDFQEKSD
jgi:hypothetical protein